MAKHLFTVDHIVFVLAVNRAELAHSIRALYGNGFDADGYLHRFFDVDFRLPDAKRHEFIDALLDSTQINEYFKTKTTGREDTTTTKNLLKGFFSAPDLSLRRIAKAIHRLGLVFASLAKQPPAFAMTAVVALVLRTIDAELYHQFRRKEISDLGVIDKMFDRPGATNIKETVEGYLFEATIIMAAHEMSGTYVTDPSEISTPLLDRHRVAIRNRKADGASDIWETIRETCVVDWVQEFHRIALNGHRITFPDCVRRIELLSTDLMK